MKKAELKEMTGTCEYCGQTSIVKAESQEDADKRATLECGCPGGEMERKKEQVWEQLNDLIGELAPSYGWEPVKPKTFKAIEEIANCVVEDRIASCSMRVEDSNLKITKSKGKINIERSKTIRMGGSIEK